MNGLTVRLYNNVVSLKNVDEFNLDNEITKAIQKLATYEDTGLEPEEITQVIKSGVPEWIDKYLEYRKLEKQGLLIKLPCKVGSTVYRILYDRNIENSKVESFEFRRRDIC